MSGRVKAMIKSAAVCLVCVAMFFVMSNMASVTWTAPEPTTTDALPSIIPTLKGLEHESWSELKKKYKDCVGFLKVGGTDINDVVVHSKDNRDYLRANPDGSYNHAGCYFIDYRCKIDLSQNTIIYGHNLADTTRKFGQLEHYRDLDFYKQNPVIYFDTQGQVGQWKIISIFLTNVDEEDGVLFYYRDRDYPTQETFLKYVERLKRRSLINCPVDVQENDRLLTLSTCDYEMNQGGRYSSADPTSHARFVVVARQTRPGEDTSVDVEAAVKNENPLMPEGWYKQYGGTMPYYPDEPLLADTQTTTATKANDDGAE